jgi:2-polyprenyl-3-methyl-5-hydroxy-6-metoxy-1,4-benzoquinol methylase
MRPQSSPDFPEYDDRSVEAWDQVAEWWDDTIGDGNAFQNVLIEPATERMLELKPGDEVLDVACGAGRFARRMAALGAVVTAFDHSERFIERARQRTTEHADRIEYRVLNASDVDALPSLGVGRFDAAVCTMALMDMASIGPLISTLPRLLKPSGRFVFSVTHPVFNDGTARKVVEEFQRDGKLVVSSGVTVTDYARAFAYEGVGIPGQPTPAYYFHRPIDMLFNTCFKHGFVLDGMEEPAFSEPTGEGSMPLSWEKGDFGSIPPVLVARMRPTKTAEK